MTKDALGDNIYISHNNNVFTLNKEGLDGKNDPCQTIELTIKTMINLVQYFEGLIEREIREERRNISENIVKDFGMEL